MKKINKLITVLMAFTLFVLLTSGNMGHAYDLDFSNAVLDRSSANPDKIQLYNVEGYGKTFWGDFKWNKVTNIFELVTSAVEGDEEFAIPFASISVDGNESDWSGIIPVLDDPVADDAYNLPGDDIVEVYIAKDNDNMYFGVKFSDGPPMSFAGPNGGGVHFEFQITATGHIFDLENQFVVYTSANYHPNSGWSASTNIHLSQPIEYTNLYSYGAGNVGVGVDFIEWFVPINDCYITSGKYAFSWSHYYHTEVSDSTEHVVRLK